MNYGKSKIFTGHIICALIVAFSCTALLAQDQENVKTLYLKFTPSLLNMDIGDIADLKIEVVDENGIVQNAPFTVRVTGSIGRRARSAIEVSPRGSGDSGSLNAKIRAFQSGSFNLSIRLVRTPEFANVQLEGDMSIEIATPALERITFVDPRDRVYTETSVAYDTEVYDTADLLRKNEVVTYTSSNPDVASVDMFGNLSAHRSGTITLSARAGNIDVSQSIRVEDNPIVRLDLTSNMEEARTGDVVKFTAVARSSSGSEISDAPIQYSYVGKPAVNLVPKGGEIAIPVGEIAQDGRFVAETPGFYTIMASTGNRTKQMTIKVVPRVFNRKLEVVGHGAVLDVRTSDLWIWEGVDGRDYAVTGTHSANGEAYFWDVTDPSNIEKIDMIKVDARTVNDVKVSEDGRIAVISREGASNRRNGLVILDVTNPREVKILSVFDDELTGGVHNIFIYQNHVYAINNGSRIDIINIEDPTNPYRVSRFELDTPGHGVHDVWIEDGVAYSSNWNDGVQLVDIGGGESLRRDMEMRNPEFNVPTQLAGSPSNPVQFASFQYPSGWNHAAFPFKSQSTDKFYVIGADEAFPRRDFQPAPPTGWMHFSEFTKGTELKEVAKYAVPEAGSHNFWIDGDLMYAAFYNGGLRIVDISGELMGDLYKQGREIDWFMPRVPGSAQPNSTNVWGAMPHKGIIYICDMNSGLWALKLVPMN